MRHHRQLVKAAAQRLFGHHLPKQNGQSLVEFAMVLPLLLRVMFGIREFGQG